MVKANDPKSVASADQHRPVVVGVDGSDGSRRALEWALHKVDTFGPVRPVMTSARASRQQATKQMERMLATVDPSLIGAATVMDAAAGMGLVRASKHSDLLVVGSRGRSAPAERLLGSVARYCAKFSRVPVAVIPRDAPVDEPLAVIVAVVDGSESSKAALRWAVDHVARDGRVIAFGGEPRFVFNYNPEPDPSGAEMDPVERFTRERVEVAVAEIQERRPDCPTVEIVVGDSVRSALREAASEADLLVVGSSGDHVPRRSVPRSMVHSLPVPTVVVPHKATA